jgi:hypothetical protein
MCDGHEKTSLIISYLLSSGFKPPLSVIFIIIAAHDPSYKWQLFK